MRVSSHSSRSASPAGARLCALGAIAALLLVIVILVTGGFTFDVGPVRVSAHRWIGAALAALLLSAVARALTRGEADRLFAALRRDVSARASLMAVVLGASAAGVGVAYGTYAASASDASGYINQADSIAHGSLVIYEPLIEALDWSDATTVLAPLGYRAGTRAGELVPTYPPGLPMLMAAAQRAAGDTAVFLVVPLLGAATVLVTYRLGIRLHSREAGLCAALLLTTSPIFLFQIAQPMSDVPATCWWTVALVLALRRSVTAWVTAGFAAGLAVLTRPNLIPLAPVIAALALLLARSERAPSSGDDNRLAWRFALSYGGGFVVPVVALLLIQLRLYGSPFASGYGAFTELFAWDAVPTNLSGYALRLWRGELPALFVAIASVFVLLVTRGRTHRAERDRAVTHAAWTAAAMSTVVLACYLPYATFSEWSYLRFLLPAFPLLFVLVGALLSNAVDRLPAPLTAVAMLAALTLAASFNIRIADREQAFRMRDYEARYRLAGRYLEAALPANAVVLAVQQSGSARYYTRLPVIRWDLLTVELDSAVSDLIARDRRPVLLVEEPEATGLRARFPRSAAARLDWRPRATIDGATTRVNVFDPAVFREQSGTPTDVIR